MLGDNNKLDKENFINIYFKLHTHTHTHTKCISQRLYKLFVEPFRANTLCKYVHTRRAPRLNFSSEYQSSNYIRTFLTNNLKRVTFTICLVLLRARVSFLEVNNSDDDDVYKEVVARETMMMMMRGLRALP